MESTKVAAGKIYTVGHSNHSTKRFLDLLAEHGIDVLVDVRSAPYTKYSVHFNREFLERSIKTAGLKYLFFGNELGGMPKNSAFYDEDGYVLYWKIAESKPFIETIERLKKGVSLYTVALMCGEENPTHCHRRLLIGRVLEESGIEVLHIRANGSIESEKDIAEKDEPKAVQMTFFSEPVEETPWRSSHTVRRV